MAFSEDLLNKFILALEHTKIPVGGDVAIRLQHIFNLLGITTAEKLAEQKFVIGPVVARSPEEQHRFYSAFDQFIEVSGVAIAKPQNPIVSVTRKNVWRARGVALLVSALIIGTFIAYHYLTRVPDPDVKFSLSDSTVVVNGDVVLKNLTDTLHNYSAFEWNFGDSTSVQKNDSVTYRYSNPGDYTITLTAYLDSQEYKSEKKVHVLAGECVVSAAFYYSRSATDKSVFSFSNQSSGEKCTNSYLWSFGDGSPDEVHQYADVVGHTFLKDGAYHVRLTAFGTDTSSAEQVVQTADNASFIKLVTIAPIRMQEKPPVIVRGKKPMGILIIFCVLLIVLPFIFAYTSYRLRKQNLTRLFKKEYPLTDPPVAPYTYQLNEGDPSIQSERKLGELAFRLRHPEQGDAIRLDILPTISGTIRSAGFPKLVFNETTTQPSYVALIDLDSGVSQQVQLFSELLETLGMYRVNFTVFYFRGSMQTCFNAAYPDGISIGKITELYESSRLVLYTNGDSLLNDDAPDGFVGWAVKIFNRWKNKAIITPVPRYNWGDRERRLTKSFPVYPAGLNGHLVMAKGFIKGRHRMFVRKKTEPWLSPFPAEMDLYREYFLRDGDKKLFTWLLALSVPEKSDWNTTLLVGKVVEDQLCVPGERLVTYGNLLRLTSVEWLQNGNLSPHHRIELYEELKKQPDAEKLIQAINKELLRELEKIVPQENSAAALEKKVQEALLNYQLSEGNDREHELHYLAQSGLLSRFAKTEIFPKKKGFTRFNPRKAIVAAGLGIFLLMSLAVPGVRTMADRVNPVPSPLADTLIDSTAAYFNNRAVEIMEKTGPGINDPNSVLNDLHKAYELDSLNEIIQANMLIYRYRKGMNLYRENKFVEAAIVFGFSPEWTFAPFLEIQSELSPLQKDSLSKALLVEEGNNKPNIYDDAIPLKASFVNQFLLFGHHAEGVCAYYLAAERQNDVFKEDAKKINSILISDSFYTIYPDKINLDFLLHGKDPDNQFVLQVIPEKSADNKPLTIIVTQNNKEVGRASKILKLPFPPGEYTVTVNYDIPLTPRKVTVLLSSDTIIRVPLGDVHSDLHQFQIRIFNSQYVSAFPPSSSDFKKLRLYEVKSGKEIYNGTIDYNYMNLLPDGEYKYIIEYPNSMKLTEQKLFLRSDTTITIDEYNPLKVDIHIDDVEGKPAVGVTITNTEANMPLGKTDNNGNLSFSINNSQLIKIELSKGNYKQSTAIKPNAGKGANMYNLILNDYTGYNVILFPSDKSGQRSTVPDAASYQAAMKEVLQKLYPLEKFILVYNSDKDVDGERTRSFPGATGIVVIFMTTGPNHTDQDPIGVSGRIENASAPKPDGGFNTFAFAVKPGDLSEFRNRFKIALETNGPTWKDQFKKK